MDGDSARKTKNQTALPASGVRILFECLPVQQGFFNLGKGQFVGFAFHLGMTCVDVLIGTHTSLDLFDIHPGTSLFIVCE